MTWTFLTRRRAMAAAGSLAAASRIARGQKLIGEPPGRIAPAAELVNAYEFEAMAQRKLGSVLSAEIAGSDRKAMDRITFNPRMMVVTSDLSLTTPLFGESLFAPILIGPTSVQKRFHPEGELAMARGASEAKTLMVISDRSSYPVDQIAAQANGPFWYQVYAEPDANAVRGRIDRAISAGCMALIITARTPDSSGGALSDWRAIDRIRQGVKVPVLLKGVMTPDEAQAAISRGFQGIVVSNYSGRPVPGAAAGILALPAIADAVGGKAPILIDGGFTRGSDVLKALALGAQGILLGRAPLWALASYGADGVKLLLQLIQNELARDMVMCGLVNMKSITRAAVTIHRR